jgi:hypothetical protein
MSSTRHAEAAASDVGHLLDAVDGTTTPSPTDPCLQEGAAVVLISLASILERFCMVMQTGWDDPEFRGLAIVLGSWIDPANCGSIWFDPDVMIRL